VYSFGVIVDAMFTDAFELDDDLGGWQSTDDMLQRIANGARWKRTSEIGAGWWRLLTNCWKIPPAERWTMQQVITEMLKNPQDFMFP
jgi:hypothetical protein